MRGFPSKQLQTSTSSLWRIYSFGLLERENPILQQNYTRLSWIFGVIFEGRKPLFDCFQYCIAKICIVGSHLINPTALRMAKTLWSFGHSECNRVKGTAFFDVFEKLFHLFE